MRRWDLPIPRLRLRNALSGALLEVMLSNPTGRKGAGLAALGANRPRCGVFGFLSRSGNHSDSGHRRGVAGGKRSARIAALLEACVIEPRSQTWLASPGRVLQR